MKIKAIFIMASLLLLFANVSFASQDTGAVEGRYQMFFSPHARADVYLVDTKTGKVWTNVQYTDVQGQPTVWKYQERIDSEKDYMRWRREQELIKQGK